MKSNVLRGWRSVASALAVCTLAFAVSVQGAPRENNSRGLDKVKSDSSRLVTSGAQMNQLLDGSVAGCLATMNVHPVNPENGSALVGSISGNTITVPGNNDVWVQMHLSGWACAGVGLRAFGTQLDGTSLTSGAGAPLEIPADACVVHADCDALYGPQSFCAGVGASTSPHWSGNGTCRQGWQQAALNSWFKLSDNSLDPWGIYGAVGTATQELAFAGANLFDSPKGDFGGQYYMGSMKFHVPTAATGSYNITLLPKPTSTLIGEGDLAIAFIIADAVIDVPTGQCCQAGGVCASDDGNKAQCVGGSFNSSKTCADPCSCLGNNANCNDGDKCTKDICNVDTCSNPLIDGFIPANQCCDTGTAALTTINDGDDCTTDSCTQPNSRGAAQHPISSAGTACNDGNDCFYNDVCDGTNDHANGGCSGTDVNGVPCTTPDDCATETGVAFDCDGGFCFCTLSPDLGFVVEGEKCVVDGDKINMAIHVGAASNPINGGQFVINYDPTCLDFNSIAPAGGNYTQEIAQIVDEAAGTIFYAVGVDFGGTGNFGNADLAVISFTKLGGCADCTVCFGGENPINTYLTDANGWQVSVTPSCSNTLIGNGELGLNVPDSIKVNSDCDSPTRTINWGAASASDTCGGTTLECYGLHRSGIEWGAAMVQGGGEFPQGDSGFFCCASNECGDSVCDGWTVRVNDQNALDVTLQMSPTMRTKPGDDLTRCIKFEVFNNCYQAPVVFEQDIHFGGLYDFVGKFTDQIKIPDAIQPHCITARDQKHSLRSCYLFDDTDCVDGVLSARFNGDPILNGNWLIGGNLDGWKKDDNNASHDVIDILDFGQFVAQWNASYDSDNDGIADGNTPCGVFSGAHADINGDGVVDILDFSFVSMNFLEDSKDCCCPAGGAVTQPRTSVTVQELRQMGMTDLISADLNSDGVVNLDDMAAFLNGNVPVKKVRGSRSLGR